MLTGEAAVTLGAVNQGMVAGDLVNTASRLQSVAAAGTVLVGEATWRAASRVIAFEEAGEQTLRGKASAGPRLAGPAGRRRARRPEPEATPSRPRSPGGTRSSASSRTLYAATGREPASPPGLGDRPRRDRQDEAGLGVPKYLDGLAEPVWYLHAGRSPAYGDGITFWALGEMVRGRAGLAEGDDEATTRPAIAERVAHPRPRPGEAALR